MEAKRTICTICGGPWKTEGSWGNWDTKQVFDALYTRFQGHCPPGICFDCWVDHWEPLAMRMRYGGSWQLRDWAFWLIAHGWSGKDAAKAVNRHYTTVWRWMREVRENPELLPDWVQGKGG